MLYTKQEALKLLEENIGDYFQIGQGKNFLGKITVAQEMIAGIGKHDGINKKFSYSKRGNYQSEETVYRKREKSLLDTVLTGDYSLNIQITKNITSPHQTKTNSINEWIKNIQTNSSQKYTLPKGM